MVEIRPGGKSEPEHQRRFSLFLAGAQARNGALDQIRGDFSDQTWQAFTRTTFEGHTSAEAAKSLGTTPNAVRKPRTRLTQLPDDLLRIMLLTFHRKSSLPIRAVGLS